MTTDDRVDGDDRLHPEVEAFPTEWLELPDSAARVHAAVLERSGGVLRGRRIRRRAVTMALAVGVYLAGVASAGWFEAVPADGPPAARAPVAPSDVAVDAAPREAAPEPTDPELLERLARQGPAKRRLDRFRMAGDEYLTQRTDVESAVRCYTDYIALAPAAERRTARSDDTWLLAALREDFN